MAEVNIVKINKNEIYKINQFLESLGLCLDMDVEYTVGAMLESEIIGTCSFSGKVLKCFAISEEHQGQGIAAKLITHLTNELFDRGVYETFIFTPPRNLEIFNSLGYATVHATREVALLEGGLSNVRKYVRNMFENSGLGDGEKAAIVMNCNPFTLGHRFIIEKVARENPEVIIFIVEENRSVFPFEVRFNLVKRGVEDLNNVHVLPGGNYIISSNTFPNYFLKKEDERLSAYTKLDAGIFGKYIAPEFNIKVRCIGTEPFDRVTAMYNTAILEELPKVGINVKLIDRLESIGIAVSASEVRRLIKLEDWGNIKRIVPDTTYEFLISDAARSILNVIKEVKLPIDG
jgi:[citrate (pro-3S)-lyase] ligase